MRSPNARIYVRFLIVFLLIGVLGLAGSAYVLVQQRAPIPFRDVYTMKAAFTDADGVTSGLGQPVNVAGVKVGQVTGARLKDGRALVTMEIERGLLPRVYEDATVVLEPITPLEDLQINIAPGNSPRPLPPGATIDVDHTNPPVPVSELLSVLDTDTRTFVSSLIASLDQGTRGRGDDMRRFLRALGPTTAQVGEIGDSLSRRRTELAGVVHNLAVVTQAASRDRELAGVVAAGNQTLESLARQDAPLGRALERLPSTLEVTRSTLSELEPFAKKLEPTVDALLPSVRRLPATLSALSPFADAAVSALRDDVRPLVREAQPLLRELDPTLRSLSNTTPRLSTSFSVLTYLVNELSYNAPGDDEGFLFWLSWFVHNFNSVVSSGDANGGIGRAFPLVTCEGLQGMRRLQGTLNVLGLCPE